MKTIMRGPNVPVPQQGYLRRFFQKAWNRPGGLDLGSRPLALKQEFCEYVGWPRDRLNGTENDMPDGPIPMDGSIVPVSADNLIAYYEPGPGDIAWMKAADRKYVFRLKSERKLHQEPNLETEAPELYAEVKMKVFNCVGAEQFHFIGLYDAFDLESPGGGDGGQVCAECVVGRGRPIALRAPRGRE